MQQNINDIVGHILINEKLFFICQEKLNIKKSIQISLKTGELMSRKKIFSE